MKLTLQLMLSVSIPISIGVMVVMWFYYKLVFQALSDWYLMFSVYSFLSYFYLILKHQREEISTQWMVQVQMQKLHNYVNPNRLICQQNFQNLGQNTLTTADLLRKQSQYTIKYNQNTKYSICSFKYQDYGQCDQTYNLLQGINELYPDIFFDRTIYQIDQFPAFDQQLAWQHIRTGFFIKAIYNTYKNSLIDVQLLYTATEQTFMYMVPAIKANFSAVTYQTCEGTSYVEPFDPRCRGWYQNAVANKGILYFQQPYVDALSGDVLMTSSIQILLGDGITNIVFAIDFGITNIITQIFDPEDQDEDGYTVLFHSLNHTIFHHRYYDSTSGLLLSWEDVEFNATNNDTFTPEQKLNFTSQVNNSLNFIENGQYDIDNFINVDGFYQRWENNLTKYFSLFYPIIITMPVSMVDIKNLTNIRILMVGRVNQDITDIVKLVNINQNPFFMLSIIVETILMVLIIIIFVLHYGAVQYHQVEIPIQMLTQFLKQNYQLHGKIEKPLKSGETKTTNTNIKKSKFFVDSGSGKKILEQSNYVLGRDDVNEKRDNDLLETPNESHRSKTDSISKLNMIKQSLMREKSVSKFSPSKNNQRQKQDSQQFEMLSSAEIQQLNFDELMSQSDTSVLKGQNKQKTNLEKENEDENKVILKNIEPMFLEMQIILETFQKLESVISYALSQQSKGSIVNSLLYFSNAKTTFSIIQNQVGLGMCYFNIGLLHLSFDRYEEAIENLLASIHCSLQELALSTLEELSQKIISGNWNAHIYTLRILSKRLLGIALILKEQYKKLNDYDCFISTQGSQNSLIESIKYFKLCIDIINATYNHSSGEQQKQAIYIEIAESYLFLNDCDNCAYYLTLLEKPAEQDLKQSSFMGFHYFQEQIREVNTSKHSSNSPFIKKISSNEFETNNLEESALLQHSYINQTSPQHSKNSNHQNNANNIVWKQNNLENQNNQNKNNPDCVSQVNQNILANKVLFLQGILSCKEQYFYLGCTLMIQSLQNSQICDPSAVYSTLKTIQSVYRYHNLNCFSLTADIELLHPSSLATSAKKQIQFNTQKLQQQQGDKQNEEDPAHQSESKQNFDLVIVLQNSDNLLNEQIMTQVNFLKFINLKFVNYKKDRVSVIMYNQILKIIQPLVIIEHKKQLNFCINYFKNEYEQLLYMHYSGVQRSSPLYSNVNPKIAFIAALKFFRFERTQKLLSAKLLQIKQAEYEEIFNHPLFQRYVEMLIGPLIEEYKQQYERYKKLKVASSFTQDNKTVISLINSHIHSETKRKSDRISSFCKKQETERIEEVKAELFSFIDNQDSKAQKEGVNNEEQTNQQAYKPVSNNIFITKLNLITQDGQFDTFQKLLETEGAKEPENFLDNSQKFITDQSNKKKSNSPLNCSKHNVESNFTLMKVKEETNSSKQNLYSQDFCFGGNQQQVERNTNEQAVFALSHETNEQTAEVSDIPFFKQTDQTSAALPLPSHQFFSHYEKSLFQSIKVENSTQMSNDEEEAGGSQGIEENQQCRKQVMIFFSFPNSDTNESIRDDIFEKISFIDKIQILHYTLNKQAKEKDMSYSNFAGYCQKSNSLQSSKRDQLNENYLIIQDYQSLIAHVRQMRKSSFYKYTLLSQYLSTNF